MNNIQQPNRVKRTTDLNLIAAYISYGFNPDSIDTSRSDRQVYVFSLLEERPVYTLDETNLPIELDVNVQDIERLYSSSRLLFLSSFPSVLRTLKQAVISAKMERQ